MKKLIIFSLLFFSVVGFPAATHIGSRIGIIGAGPSGLVAALELQKRGFKPIVLEGDNQVAGKVRTVVVDDHPYEMGAVITAPNYHLILKLAKELNVRMVETPRSIVLDRQGQEHSLLEWSKALGWMRFPKLTKDFANFSLYVTSHKDFFEPGFTHTPSEMHTTFEEFAQEQGFYSVLEQFRPVMVGCGYSYASTSAPYWMKLMTTFGHEYPKSALFGGAFYQGFWLGWQSFWQQLVDDKDLDVRLNNKVTHIERDIKNQIVRVDTEDNHYEFDKVILTVPQYANKLLSLTADEERAFSKVHSFPYKVTLARVENLPELAHIWIRENSYEFDEEGHSNDGKPVLISSNHKTNVYQIYQFTITNKSDDELRFIMNKTIGELGATVTEVILESTFDYFPHFDADAFRDGIPQNLDKLQGHGNLFYTGALFNFETVELAAEHAKKLVEEHF